MKQDMMKFSNLLRFQKSSHPLLQAFLSFIYIYIYIRASLTSDVVSDIYLNQSRNYP